MLEYKSPPCKARTPHTSVNRILNKTLTKSSVRWRYDLMSIARLVGEIGTGVLNILNASGDDELQNHVRRHPQNIFQKLSFSKCEQSHTIRVEKAIFQ